MLGKASKANCQKAKCIDQQKLPDDVFAHMEIVSEAECAIDTHEYFNDGKPGCLETVFFPVIATFGCAHEGAVNSGQSFKDRTAIGQGNSYTDADQSR